MREIESEKDVKILVNTFYIKVRKDDLLGPIFKSHIEEERWPVHLEKLKDFWMAHLFGVSGFNGNPTGAHFKVDKQLNHNMSEKHFAQWLKLWSLTIDSLFFGERADIAKQKAQRMANGQFGAVLGNRPVE